MKTILLTLTAITLLLIPTVNFAQVNDLSAIADNVSSNVVLEGINVYPNPTTGNITMQFKSTNGGNYVVNIVDVTGKLVYSDRVVATEGLNLFTIDLSREIKGIYLLTLEDRNGKEQKRIVLQ